MRHQLVLTICVYVTAAFGQQKDLLSITGGKYTLHLDRGGSVKKVAFANRAFEPPLSYSYFELDGKAADAEVLGNTCCSFQLTAEKLRGVLQVSYDNNLRFHFAPSESSGVKDVGLVLTFPIDTVFHLAEYKNTGRTLDKDMPVGESYKGLLEYNMVAAEWRGMWLRFRSSDKQWLRRADFQLIRHPQMFTATFTWRADADAQLAVFSSLEELLADQRAWMEAESGIRKLKERPGVPAWVHDIRLIVTVDMMRGNWEIAHDFQDLLKLAAEIKDIRNPKEVLFYIPGWQGPYDSTHPIYRPHPELGGEEKFREALAYLQKQGFHVMVHTTIYGIDPYRQENRNLQEISVKDATGAYKGFMFENWGPSKLPLKFRTPRIPLRPPAGSTHFSFKTDPIPDECEAYLRVGGVKSAKAQVRFTIGRRAVSTPAGCFEKGDSCDLPFPFALSPGANEVTADIKAEPGADLSQAWYQVRLTYKGDSPYQSWSFPILMGDTTRKEYQDVFIESLRSVIQDFKIDAVHVDAGTFWVPVRSRELYYKLRDAIPGVALGTENYQTYEEMNYFQISQLARQHMKNYRATLRCPCEQSAVAPQEGMDEFYAWLNKPSPICRFVKDYMIVYPHLCAADAFVPVGKVCNHEPQRQMPPRKEELWKTLAEVKRLDYTPGIRVNYRKYGLDKDTRKAIRELGR